MSLQIKFPAYQAQLLRIWIEHADHPVWRFSLEDVTTGERCGFADLDALICYLLDVMDKLVAQQKQESNKEHPDN